MRHLLFLLTAIVLSAAGVYADLHDPANSADYLIVTTDSLITSTPWISDLAAWRQSHGRTAMVVATDDIWNEFGNGTPSDTVLKEFFHYAREHWALPQLRDVFIIGFHDIVPSHVEPDSVSDERVDYLTDFFYTQDPDSITGPPLFTVGRLPWSPAFGSPLPNYYTKVVAYETAPEEPWQQTIHLIADYTDEMFNFWHGYSEPLVLHIQGEYSIERDYLDFPIDNSWHGDRDEVIQNFNLGSFISFYNGHFFDSSDTYGDGWMIWSETLHLDSSVFAELGNGSRMPIVVGMGWDVEPVTFTLSSIPYSLLANPAGGAIGYFGWAIGWAYTGVSIKTNLIHKATSDSIATLGDIWLNTQLEFGGYRFLYAGNAMRETALGFYLFGDPGLVLPARPSAVEELHTAYPAELRLTGNYPNPFNASTQIRFELDRTMHVSLRVFDVTGREAAVLVDGVRPAGEFHVQWDAARFSSGMYFAVLQAGKVRQVQKMMLLK